MVKRLSYLGLLGLIHASLVASGSAASYSAAVLADNPVGYWRLTDVAADYPLVENSSTLGATLDGTTDVVTTSVGVPGPRSPEYVGLESDNVAMTFLSSDIKRVFIDDPGTDNVQLNSAWHVRSWWAVPTLHDDRAYLSRFGVPPGPYGSA